MLVLFSPPFIITIKYASPPKFPKFFSSVYFVENHPPRLREHFEASC